MNYALLYAYDPTHTGPADDEVPAWVAFDTAVRDAGIYVYEAGFHPATTARTISVRQGTVTTEDGAGARVGDVLAGFYILNVPDLETAMAWAQQLPTATYGTVGIRPIVDYEA